MNRKGFGREKSVAVAEIRDGTRRTWWLTVTRQRSKWSMVDGPRPQIQLLFNPNRATFDVPRSTLYFAWSERVQPNSSADSSINSQPVEAVEAVGCDDGAPGVVKLERELQTFLHQTSLRSVGGNDGNLNGVVFSPRLLGLRFGGREALWWYGRQNIEKPHEKRDRSLYVETRSGCCREYCVFPGFLFGVLGLQRRCHGEFVLDTRFPLKCAHNCSIATTNHSCSRFGYEVVDITNSAHRISLLLRVGIVYRTGRNLIIIYILIILLYTNLILYYYCKSGRYTKVYISILSYFNRGFYRRRTSFW
ncbi:hypothetical protein B0T20DRAFT_397346 [Sordaria brevicollis]|uniref:Uncharacterized protein n=1 Tax=Sordaria brevicollis TaxID=83679 RepID=A0AAE0U325_SORBR|nr:hypothetical protein B0T20DRAFT_397346 [Sordaria brevicollis]